MMYFKMAGGIGRVTILNVPLCRTETIRLEYTVCGRDGSCLMQRVSCLLYMPRCLNPREFMLKLGGG